MAIELSLVLLILDLDYSSLYRLISKELVYVFK